MSDDTNDTTEAEADEAQADTVDPVTDEVEDGADAAVDEAEPEESDAEQTEDDKRAASKKSDDDKRAASKKSDDDKRAASKQVGKTDKANASDKGSDKGKASAKAKADAAVAARKTAEPARRTVTSRRVTPKGGAVAAPTSGSKARDAKKTESVVTRAPVVTSQQVYSKGPSPWWVPAIMFTLLILGGLIIMANYALPNASNVRLVIGLGFILGGIIAATQYR